MLIEIYECVECMRRIVIVGGKKVKEHKCGGSLKSMAEAEVSALKLREAVLGAAPQPTWISVEERLPEPNTRVLVWFQEHDGSKWAYRSRFGEISCGHWRPEGGNGNFDDRITYWMPDLDPPKLEPTAPEEKKSNE